MDLKGQIYEIGFRLWLKKQKPRLLKYISEFRGEKFL
jgi:hypothetical protein